MTPYTVNGNILTVQLRGEIDHHSAGDLSKETDTLIRRYIPKKLVLDFGNISFCDSSGIALVLGRYRLMKESGGQTVLASLPPHIRKIFTLASLDKYVEMN